MSDAQNIKSELERLKEEAENEMRRVLPEEPSAKRPKLDSEGGEGDGPLPRPAQHLPLVASRFNYAAVQELATGLQGFLATCMIKREQSSIKEVARVLDPFIDSKECSKMNTKISDKQERQSTPVDVAAANNDPPVATATAQQQHHQPKFSSVKLSACGLVVLKLESPADDDDPVAIGLQTLTAVTDLLSAIEAEKLPRLQFVQRLMPLQTTCRFDVEGLKEAGQRLAPIAFPLFKGDKSLASKPSFAVAYKSRSGSGVPTHPIVKGSTSRTGGPAPTPEEDRKSAIMAVASGFQETLEKDHNISVCVNLKSPDVVLLVEMLPALTGMHAGLAVVPASLCTLKPKIGLKAVGVPRIEKGADRFLPRIKE